MNFASPLPAAHQSTSRQIAVTLAAGDGIGPEITAAVLRVLEHAGANISFELIEVGEAVYRRGVTSGIPAEAWESLRRTRLFLKGPITTPQGGGYKSLNVTMRKTLGLFANVRPCVALHPFVESAHPGMDVTIIRENEEDTYAGIEHRQTPEVTQCLKLISRPGCERIVRYAFEFARRYGRKRVTCFTKDNIMKLTDGLFHRVFDEIGAHYPDIDRDHLIIDIGAALLADRPERFDVVVAPNLYGDIISDIAAQVAGSIGMAGSANIGTQCAMFEAVHGSAPDIAGRDMANPSGLLQAAVMLLVHVGQVEAAARIQNAWLRTLEDGIHTGDIASDATTRKVGTREFADAIVERLGKCPRHLRAAHYAAMPAFEIQTSALPRPAKALVGVDVFLDWDQQGRDPLQLASLLQPLAGGLALKMITNRGVKVWPDGLPETFCTDHWRCRFVPAGAGSIDHEAILALLGRLAAAGVDFIKTENLYTFDGQPGYSLGQGE